MADIKSVLILLCNNLEKCLNIKLKPEFFQAAKHNKDSNEAIDALWEVLYKLCHNLVTFKNPNFSLDNIYDLRTRVKLYLAYLQFKDLRFYTLSQKKNENSRLLLIAITWLLAKNALDISVDMKYTNSTLGKEFSHTDIVEQIKEIDETPAVMHMYSIVQACGKLSHNMKQITELLSEKLKFATKVHLASQGASGLPHLNVSEMALVKRFVTINNDDLKLRQEQLKKLLTDAQMLDTHRKWTRKSHIFYEWMVNIMIDKNIQSAFPFTESHLNELIEFISILRQVINKRLHNNIDTNCESVDCPTRLLKVQGGHVEVETWLIKMTEKLTQAENNLDQKRQYLKQELNSLIQLIPNCVEV